MDRNQVAVHFDTLSAVALRKESVDRNHVRNTTSALPSMSLSARRAWIEIAEISGSNQTIIRSLSARRAWIEIMPKPGKVKLVERRSPQGERG